MATAALTKICALGVLLKQPVFCIHWIRVYLLQIYPRKPVQSAGVIFLNKLDAFLTPKQRCQSTEGIDLCEYGVYSFELF